MIDTKDLMIGNWVYQGITKAPFPVMAVSDETKLVYLGTPEGFYVEDVAMVIPIPVTPELLERIGFEYVESKGTELWKEWYYLTEKYKLLVRDISNSPNKEWYVHIDNADFDSIGSGDFQYLHELQNLVRVITGHDLPITKEMLG